ncbi:MAG: translation initiation factor [Campylobacterales bacterium]
MKLEIGAKLDEEPLEFQGKGASKKVSKNTQSIKPISEHLLVFRFEKRNGKPVTIVGRFFISQGDKKALLKFLKTKLACGGKYEGEWIELQGDIKDRVKECLIEKGWKFKSS